MICGVAVVKPHTESMAEKVVREELTDRLCDQPRQDVLFVMLRYRGNDGSQGRNIPNLVLLRKLGAQTVEVDIPLWTRTVLGRLMVFDKCACDLSATSQEPLVLRWEIRILLPNGRRDCCGRGGHLACLCVEQLDCNFRV